MSKARLRLVGGLSCLVTRQHVDTQVELEAAVGEQG